MWKYICYAISLTLGASLILGGALVIEQLPHLLGPKIKSNLVLLNGTEAFTRYTQSSVPLNVKMYLFNVTNPEEVTSKGAKPKLAQLGPFVFAERRKKQVINISPDNTTLDYKLFRTYYFNQTASIPLSSIITLPNAPAFSAMFAAEVKYLEENSMADPREVVSEHIKKETIYITNTAENWLFKGIKLNFLDTLEEDGIISDDPVPDNTFGFYYKKNNTWDEKADGIMTISTGVDGNFSNIGKVTLWNRKKSLDFWSGTCNELRGTDGQFFHPFIDKSEKLEIFAPDLCRTLSIEYNSTVYLRSIELYRYGLAKSFFSPINSSPATSCYCVKKEHAEKQSFCKLGGVSDVSSCRKKPIVLSTPHFLNADPSLQADVEGLAPNQQEHGTAIDIEPMTGSVFRVRRRLQVNVEMRPNEYFPNSVVLGKGAFKKGLIHPFIWMDQQIEIPDELAQKFENKLTKKVRYIKISSYAALIVGPLILSAILIYICTDISREDKKIQNNKRGNSTNGGYQKVNVVMKSMGNNS